MDKEYNSKVEKWLSTPKKKQDVQEGATLLLQLNKNRIFFQNVTARPDKLHDKLIYELRKAYNIRMNSAKMKEARILTPKVLNAASTLLEEHAPVISTDDDTQGTKTKGKRDDHDELPPEVQELWDGNAAIYCNIKQIYTQLQSMDAAHPEERLPLVKQLATLDKTYRNNLKLYDAFDPSQQDEAPAGDKKGAELSPKEANKKINNARKYLSDNKKKLPQIEDAEKAQELLSKMQQRYDLLVSLGATMEQEQKQELKALGLDV